MAEYQFTWTDPHDGRIYEVFYDFRSEPQKAVVDYAYLAYLNGVEIKLSPELKERMTAAALDHRRQTQSL